FVWTYKGRPEAVASIFSHPEKGRRVVVHELHVLSTEVLQPLRDGAMQWQPKAGLAMKPLLDAPAPADSARQRQFQLRSMARVFPTPTCTSRTRRPKFGPHPTPLTTAFTTTPSSFTGSIATGSSMRLLRTSNMIDRKVTCSMFVSVLCAGLLLAAVRGAVEPV